MSQHELMPAIALFEKRLDETERKANRLREMINEMRAEAGLPPLSPSGGGGGGGNEGIPTQIKPDTFFGKKQQSALREYLEMRRAQGNGPAKPRELYDGLLAGGYQYEAKDAETALVGLRALLRKRTNTFIRLPNGTYGLTAWYPDARKPRAAPVAGDDDEGDSDVAEDSETAATPEDPEEAAVA